MRFYIIENATIKCYDGDPNLIDLVPHREVLIVTGSPLTVVPKYQWPVGVSGLFPFRREYADAVYTSSNSLRAR
ncbi:MAG: hypothetical protein ACJ73N_13030 [Bryobacteraceae bacterium]